MSWGPKDVIADFRRGQSVAAMSNTYGVSKLAIEEIIRRGLASEEGAGRGERFRLEGEGLIDTEGGLDRCTGCGHLPPHEGCKAICAACAPPTGACFCVGCAIHAQGFRAGVEAAVEMIRDHYMGRSVNSGMIALLSALSPPAPSTSAPATGGYVQTGGSCSCGRFLWALGAPTFLDKEGIEHSKDRCAAPAPGKETKTP